MNATPGSAPLRIAVVGAGIGGQHLHALAALPELYTIDTVCDLDASKAARAAERFGATPTTDFHVLLSNPDLDLISVCTPPWLHEQQTIAALRAGKHVVTEKPMVGSLEALDSVEAAMQASGRVAFPVYNYRFGPSFQEFLALLRTGQLGEPLVATAEVGFLRGADYYAGSWRGTIAGELGGCLASHAIHHFDMLLATLGRPVSVGARMTTKVNDIETEDCAAGMLEFPGGVMGSFAVTLGCVEEYSRVRFVFANGVVEFGPGPYETMSQGAWHLAGIERPEGDVSAASDTGFMGMFRQIHAAVTGAPNHAPTIAQARDTLELVTGLYASAAERTVIDLPIDPVSDWYRSWN